MSSQDGERTEAQTIPFPEGETKVKQNSRPGRPSKMSFLFWKKQEEWPVNLPDRLVLEVTGYLLQLA